MGIEYSPTLAETKQYKIEKPIGEEKELFRSLAEVQREIEDLTGKVAVLDKRLAELKREERTLQLEKLLPVVGMTLRTHMGDVRIIGLPEVVLQKTGLNCNMYEFPVLIIDKKDDEAIPFYEGTLHSQAVDSDDPAACLRNEYEEMNEGEWLVELNEAFEKMKRRVNT